jgi:pimeloyl-ACP methyl ester carboxylesterase
MAYDLPLLLLPSAVADRRMWTALLPAFEARHRVLAPDLRGSGDEPYPEGEYSHVDDLVALLDREGVDRVAVVGASNGGRVAIDLALAHPDRIAALVLAAPGLGGWAWSDEVEAYGAREDELFEQRDLEGMIDLNLEMWVDGSARGPDDVDPGVRELVREMQRRSFEHVAQAYAEEPYPTERRLEPPAVERLGELRVPILVVLGALDVSDFAAIGERLGQEAGARVVEFENVAHLPSLEQPERFAALVLEFLDGRA